MALVMKVNILIIEGTPDALTVNDPDFSMFRSDLICLLIGTLKMVKVLNVRHDAATQPYDFGVLIRGRPGWCKLLTRNIVLYGRIPYVVEGQTRMSASTFRSGLTSSSGYKHPRHPSAPSPLLSFLPLHPHYVCPWSRPHLSLFILHSFLAQVAAHMPISMSVHLFLGKLLPSQMDSPNPSDKISPPSASPTP